MDADDDLVPEPDDKVYLASFRYYSMINRLLFIKGAINLSNRAWVNLDPYLWTL